MGDHVGILSVVLLFTIATSQTSAFLLCSCWKIGYIHFSSKTWDRGVGVSLDGVSLDGVSLDGVSLDGVSLDGVSLGGVSL